MSDAILVQCPAIIYKTKIKEIFQLNKVSSIDGLDKIPNLRTISVFVSQGPGQNRTVHWRKDLSIDGRTGNSR